MVLDRKWKDFGMRLAIEASTMSKDPSTQVGCAIFEGKTVKSLGYNGFPKGCSDHISLYESRALKYMRVQHAEINAIINYKGDLSGCTAYVTHMPCSSCMGALINAGIKSVVTAKPEGGINERFKESFEVSKQMARECGLNIEVI